MTGMIQIGPLTHRIGSRTLVMGVLNATPDSFSDGGRFSDIASAQAQLSRMAAEGADIIDIGGESTRPGASEIGAQEECDRVLPVLESARSLGCAITIDTYKASVAQEALAAGAHAINDVWGLQRDSQMAPLAARHDVPLIIMHNRAQADDTIDILADIRAFFERSLKIAAAAGLSRDRIIVDPGIGFGKTQRQNLVVLNRLAELKRAFALPMLVGSSRKSLIGALTGREVAHERLIGSLAAHLTAAANGADIVRVHDVGAHVEALRVADAVRRETMD